MFLFQISVLVMHQFRTRNKQSFVLQAMTFDSQVQHNKTLLLIIKPFQLSFLVSSYERSFDLMGAHLLVHINILLHLMAEMLLKSMDVLLSNLVRHFHIQVEAMRSIEFLNPEQPLLNLLTLFEYIQVLMDDANVLL